MSLEQELLGGRIHALRFAWKFRHRFNKRVERDRVRSLVEQLRWCRERWPGVTPRLPVRCGHRTDNGWRTALRTRHMWGPNGAGAEPCACEECAS